MLVLGLKLDEIILLKDRTSGAHIATIEPQQGRYGLRLAFQAPGSVEISRQKKDSRNQSSHLQVRKADGSAG